jgi:hypothetical protein
MSISRCTRYCVVICLAACAARQLGNRSRHRSGYGTTSSW